MLFSFENAAKFEDILKIPIPYTQELEETEFEKFQRKIQSKIRSLNFAKMVQEEFYKRK